MTMAYQTMEELHDALHFYNQFVREVPQDFFVCAEHLKELTRSAFCKAFKMFRDLTVALYDEAAAYPADYGYAVQQKRTGIYKPTTLRFDVVFKLYLSMGRAGRLDGKRLVVDREQFQNIYGTPNSKVEKGKIQQVGDDAFLEIMRRDRIELFLHKLSDFGFRFEGCGTDMPWGMEKTFIVTHEEADIPVVLKAFADIPLSSKSYEYDFRKFNYKVFSVPKDERLPFEDQYTASYIPSDKMDAAKALIAAMKEIGADYGDCAKYCSWQGRMACYYIFKNKLRIIQNMDGMFVFAPVVGKIRRDRRIAFMENLPERYKAIYARCEGCRAECDGRIPISINGKMTAVCSYKWPSIPAEMEAVPYIVEAYQLMGR